MDTEEASEVELSEAVTPARAILIAPAVAERIEIISGMMERLEWDRGKSAPILAAEWGLAVATVEKNAAEASRRVTGDKEEAVRDITVGARQLYRKAVLAGNARDAKAIGDLWASVTGANAPIKQDINLGPASPSEAARLVRESFGSQAAQVPVVGSDPEPA